MTPCTAPRCGDAARWTVADRQLCRRHMLDALLAGRIGQAHAVPLEAEALEVEPEPVARLTNEEREVLGRVADDAAFRAMGHTETVVRGLLERTK